MTSPDRADQIRRLFHELIGLPQEERDGLLSTACGEDHGLRREMETLLAAADAEASGVRRALNALRPDNGSPSGSDGPSDRSSPPEALRAALADRYILEHEIGRGGMATVYLAEDLKHHRRVAIKVLDPDVAAAIGHDRFLREIETAANLTHPHILPLHDSGEADGFLYYVMPYVEGESLRVRLDREPQLPVEEAVRITCEVASALAYAHDHGVIHRDVKPANVLLEAGQAVLADFGVAQAVGAVGRDRLTETGLSLGTPHYMSPEQATGGDHIGPATDIYALGCVLYEMLVGEPPFTGSTPQAVLGKIIAGEPVAPTEQRFAIPPHVDASIRRALERFPADRFRTASDFGQALGDEHFGHGPATAGAGLAASGPWNRLTMAMTGLAVVLALAFGWSLLRPEEPEPVERFSLAVPDGWLPSAAINLSPDGSAIVVQGVFEGSPQLFLRRLGDLVPKPIPGTERGIYPTISPDGREVAFLQARQLKIVPLQGGVVRTVADSAICCTTWGADGFVYYNHLRRWVARVPASGGTVEAVTGPDDEGRWRGDFKVLPGGEVAVYVVNAEPWHIEAMRITTGERKVLMPGILGIPLPEGYLTIVTLEGDVLVAPFDPGTLELTGAAVPVIAGVWVASNASPSFAVSESGTVAYWSNTAWPDLELVWVTRSGQVSPVEPGWTFNPDDNDRGWALSPDETRLALNVRTELGTNIWIKELPDGPLSRVTFGEGQDWYPRWTPDGESVTFTSLRGGGNRDVWTKRADGTGTAQLLFDYGRSIAEAVWSPNGEWLVMRTSGSQSLPGYRDIFGLRPGVDSILRPLVVSEHVEAGPALSPDGRWLAYQSDETGRREVFIRPFPDTEGRKVQVSDEGGRAAVWARSGRELYYVTHGLNAFGRLSARDVMVAEIRPGPPLTVGERRVLFSLPAGFYFENNTTSYLVTSDDQRFLMAREVARTEEQNRGELILIQNFPEMVKDLVPG